MEYQCFNPTMKKVHLSYYAMFKEVRGIPEESIQTTAATAQKLYDELQARYHFKLSVRSLNVAINDQICPWHTIINSGDHIVFIPPVSGG